MAGSFLPAPDVSLLPLERLRAISARLRAPDGCPWDREQTHTSLRAALLEETHEVLAAIEAGDDVNLREELGDLLLHVVMHAQMASERDAFDLDGVASGACEKMIRRHPHVFGADGAADSAAVLVRWDAIKRQEKGTPEASRMSGLLDALPALLRAQKAQEKAARAGFDWASAAGVRAKMLEELAEVCRELDRQVPDPAAIEEEIGDLLFTAVNLARWQGLEAELALQRATTKFVSRFRRLEEQLLAAGRCWEDATPEYLDALWEQIKTLPAGTSSMNERASATVKNNDPAV